MLATMQLRNIELQTYLMFDDDDDDDDHVDGPRLSL
jgi:hypothetical protein